MKLKFFFTIVLVLAILMFGVKVECEAYSIVISERTVPSPSVTVPHNTTTLLGYLEPDFGAKLFSFYNAYNILDITTQVSNNKTGTITLIIKENDENGNIVYQSSKSYSQYKGVLFGLNLPTEMIVLNPNVDRLAIFLHHNMYYTNPDVRYMSLKVLSTADGSEGWRVVNIDLPTSEILNHTNQTLQEIEGTKQIAEQAKISAETAAASANTAVGQTIDDGVSAASWAHQAYDKANDLSEQITNLQTSITYIQNNDIMPPIVDVQTVSGARATSGGSIQAIVSVIDNRPGPYTYSINGGPYITLPVDGRITLPVTFAGNNTISVYVKDAAGNIGNKTITIRKL